MNEKEMRKLDAYLAEHVMGWNQVEKIGMVEHGRFHYRPSIGEVFILKQGNTVQYFHPTTNPAAAMMVLEKCCEKLSSFDVCIWKGATRALWYCGARKNTCDITMFAKAPTLPLAICLFAKQLFHAQEKETKVH